MTTRDVPFAPGTPCWVDLGTSDIDGARTFYSSLFDWTPTDRGEEFGGYVSFSSGGHAVAGLVSVPSDSGRPSAWNTYISTSDVNATTKLVTDAGGRTLMPPMQVADLGTMAVLNDPAGATVGLWQPDTFFGFNKYNEPGSVTWDECHSKDFSATIAFYEKVFGWTYEIAGDTDEFRYYQGHVDGQVVAGLMDSKSFLPVDVPSHWAVYFSVASVDDTIANAKALGGSVNQPAQDTPFGRVADLSDPTGAAFKLHSA